MADRPIMLHDITKIQDSRSPLFFDKVEKHQDPGSSYQKRNQTDRDPHYCAPLVVAYSALVPTLNSC